MEKPYLLSITVKLGKRCYKGEGTTYALALENILHRPNQYVSAEHEAWIRSEVSRRKRVAATHTPTKGEGGQK